MAFGGVLVEACGLAGAQAGDGGFEAEEGGGLAAGAADGFFEGAAGEVPEVGDGAVEGEDGAGEGFGCVGEGGFAVRGGYGQAGEGVGAVGHAGGGDAVGDEDGALAFETEPKADECGVNVDAVADELGEEVLLFEDVAEDAGLAVVERAHGVEDVGGGEPRGAGRC